MGQGDELSGVATKTGWWFLFKIPVKISNSVGEFKPGRDRPSTKQKLWWFA